MSYLLSSQSIIAIVPVKAPVKLREFSIIINFFLLFSILMLVLNVMLRTVL